MKRYFIFGSAGLGLLMYSIDSTAVAVAFPHLIRDLHTNVLWAGWTVSIYLLAVMSSMPLMGILSDAYGRKKVYLASLVLFTVSSLACGFAPNIYSLLIFRFLQGIGGASFLPTAAGIVSDQFPENRERAIGLFTSIFPIGGIIGPNLGGWIISQYSWRHIFYINLPIGIVLISLITILLHDGKVSAKPHIDLAGAAFFFGAILFLMLGLNHFAEDFSLFSLFWAALWAGASVFSLYLFFRQEKKASNPILDMALLKSRPFLAANLFNMIIGAGVFGVFAFIPLYAISVQKLTVLASGMILTPRSIGMISTSAMASFLLKRWGYRRPIVLGVILLALATLLLADQSFLLFSLLGIHLGATKSLLILILVTGVGLGILLPGANNACIELMPEKVATITGLRGMFRSVGGVCGISLITIILHLSSTPARGFRTVFIGFGLGLLLAIPLAYLMPSGRKGVDQYLPPEFIAK
ncbi:MAG: MFS transporter [Syntrophales bacterium]|jgi:EmrB/QacA subfamily drug resistance transporter|nr:MFS transporter [Syntrophales bacterium]